MNTHLRAVNYTREAPYTHTLMTETYIWRVAWLEQTAASQCQGRASAERVLPMAVAGPEVAADVQALAPPGERPEWQTEEKGEARQMIFLVTFAGVLADTVEAADTPLRTLDDLTRQHILDAVLDAIAHPVVVNARGGRPRSVQAVALKVVVFLEEPRHFHVALKVSSKCRFLPFKLALRQRAGLASHWSTSHTQWWSAVRYGAFATARKPQVDLAPLTWSSTGESLALYEESQEPFNAKAFKGKREATEMRVAAMAADQGVGSQAVEKPGKFTKLDFTALVIAHELQTPAAVLSYAQAKGSVQLQNFVCRNQAKLPELLAHATAWQGAEADAATERESDWALIVRLSSGSCACGPVCVWAKAAASFCERNAATLDGDALAACLAKVICEGPSKTARVPLIAGVSNAGKSTLLDPLDNVFGPDKVLHTPALGATMPLANLALGSWKRFIYWDEFRPVEFAALPARQPTVPAITFMKLFSGQRLEVQVSQSLNNGNKDICWTHGAAFTAKAEGLWDMQGHVSAEDIRHMQNRVWQFDACSALPDAALQAMPKCKETFCKWLVSSAARFATRAVPAVLPIQEEADPVDSRSGCFDSAEPPRTGVLAFARRIGAACSIRLLCPPRGKAAVWVLMCERLARGHVGPLVASRHGFAVHARKNSNPRPRIQSPVFAK